MERMNFVWRTLMNTPFMDSPSAAHPSVMVRGGLLKHSIRIWQELENYTRQLNLEWERPSSPFVIAMLHRAYEMDAYYYEGYTSTWELKQPMEEDTGLASLKVAERLGITLTDEEKACILHYNRCSKAAEEYPKVVYVYAADILVRKHYGEGGCVNEK